MHSIVSTLSFVIIGAGDPATKSDLDNKPVATLYLRTDGGAGSTLYVKEGAGSGGWAAK